ncbi:MAG: hypothetical protein K2J02_01435 [Malacoplasma sp.]|nr:hypothetical protein [Malacoplasma sp.]MDE7075599.1 hypothetical protein [Malacoplasma sp.]
MNQENTNFETRVKKYKQYRRKIKNDYSNFIRRSSKSDEVKKIEKSISKINKDLLINDFSSKLFVDFTSNWTNDDGYVVSVKNYLDTAKNNKFNELLSKADSVRNEIDMEPSFDQQGNLSLSWYKQDPKYIELEKIKNWIQLMTQEKDQIVNNVKDKIFSFKDAFYRTSDRETISSILPIEQSFSKIEKNDKNRKILFIFLWSFFATIAFAILFIILFIFV